MENIAKIKALAKSRIQEFIDIKDPWYKWHQTYIDWIQDEFDEIKKELKQNNTVYLEDELWDLFWDFMCLLNSLEHENMITSQENVFKRAYEKFHERISEVRKEGNEHRETWKNIKSKQKAKREKEHKEKHW